MQLQLPRLILRWVNENRGTLSIQSFIIKALTESQNFKNYEEQYGSKERK
ncbi:hypothetical protein KXJ75_11050 [Aeromonas sanarellii]|nr:hypothetical protein KXJ75_11050 [Aeromonas sanarellii]